MNIIERSKLADRTYFVGGCVRDELMEYDCEDIDYVVEATEEEFRKEFPVAPLVGRDFPVFLIEGDEVALTRIERSTGKGYGDFAVEKVGVSIIEDLGRRDFTINAIARNCATREIVDPFNGIDHIKKGIIKACFENTFVEDPVRILRAARFAARFHFKIDAQTLEMMHDSAGMLIHVTKERIALEFEKVYKQAVQPSRFFKILENVGALHHIFPSLANLAHVPAGPVEWHGRHTAFDHTMEAIDRASHHQAPFHVFMAVLCHDLGKGITPAEFLPRHPGHEENSEQLANEWLSKQRFSKRVNEFVPKFASLHMKAHWSIEMSARKLVKFAKNIGRRDFEDVQLASRCDREFTAEEFAVFEMIKQVLFHTDLKFLADVPVKQRAQRGHQAMVTHMKRLMSERSNS
jgi:tRNA nucleotidyltransferase (CCA-adding enzyme)